MKSVAMRGEIQDREPYVIKLTNTYDNRDVIQSALTIDSDKKNIVFSTNYDLGNNDKGSLLV